MKKYLVLAGMGLVAAAGLGWVLLWSLDICRPLDRLLGLSGCSHSVEITDFSPLVITSMSPTDDSGMASLYGQVRTADGYQPGLIRLDPLTGAEEGRYPLPIQNGFVRVVLSNDGNRASVSCMSAFDCLENGDALAIVDARNGRLIETLGRQRDLFPRVFPGDPEPGAQFHYTAQFVDNGDRIVTEDDEGRLALQDLSGNTIAILAPRFNPFDNWITVSPSSRHIALVRRVHNQRATIEVWSSADGAPVASFTASGDNSIGLAWSHQETAVFAIINQGRQHFLERYAM